MSDALGTHIGGTVTLKHLAEDARRMLNRGVATTRVDKFVRDELRRLGIHDYYCCIHDYGEIMIHGHGEKLIVRRAWWARLLLSIRGDQ